MLYKRIASKIVGPTVYNESGSDVDLRMEGDTNQNLFFLDASADNIGIGTATPAEILHIAKTTGNFTTARFDSGTTQGYFYSYDGDTSVNFGSNSAAEVNIKYNNTTVATFGLSSDVSFNTQNPSGDRTILQVKAPSSSPEEATVTTMLDLGSGNTEFIDWTIEDYAGFDHKASINIAKAGTGTLIPFIIRYWDSDLGPVATFGKTYFTITPSVEVIINDDSQDVDFRVESDGNANMLFVDAGNNRVGIGTNAPNQLLHLLGTDNNTLTVESNNTAGTSIVLYNSSVNGGHYEFFSTGSSSGAGAGHFGVYNQTSTVTPFFILSDSSIEMTRGFVANQVGGDFDSRIEGDTDTNLIFVDASTDRVGIGTATPSAKLDVNGSIVPTTNDVGALGNTSLKWADLFLASGAVINFNNGNITLTHAAGKLTMTGGSLGIGGSPSEILHLIKGTGEFTTIRFDSGTTQGYFYAYDGDNSVNIGANSSSVLNLKVNNATVWSIDVNGDMTLKDGGDFILGSSTGTKIGTATTQKLGFYNAGPIIQQTDGADLTNSVTSGGSDNVIADFTNLTVYATDAATIRNDIYQLARKVKIIGDALRDYGLLS